MTVGLTDYNIKQKNDWRGWAWNRIVERFPEFAGRAYFDVKRMSNQDRKIVAEKTAVYLCGPDDLDRQHAMRLGFQSANLIAIDTSSENITKIRAAGGIGIVGRLDDILAAWPRDWMIDAVLADLCCGVSNEAILLGHAFYASRAIDRSTVFVANLQRGRDPASNSLRSHMERAVSDLCNTKHRGVGFQLLLAELWKRLHGYSGRAAVDAIKDQVHHMQASSMSYRARRVVMDSICMRMLPTLVSSEIASEARSEALAEIGRVADKSVGPKLAALRAVRTMKINRENN